MDELAKNGGNIRHAEYIFASVRHTAQRTVRFAAVMHMRMRNKGDISQYQKYEKKNEEYFQRNFHIFHMLSLIHI